MRLATWLLAGCLAVTCGCGDSKPTFTMQPTSGEVQYNGQPAAGVQVFLYPTSAPGVPDVPANPHGVTGADGKFTIGTYTESDGAAEGGYQIILLWPTAKKASEEGEDKNTDRLLGWYDAKRSNLTVQIKAGSNSIPTIKIPAITGPPPESKGVPGRN